MLKSSCWTLTLLTSILLTAPLAAQEENDPIADEAARAERIARIQELRQLQQQERQQRRQETQRRLEGLTEEERQALRERRRTQQQGRNRQGQRARQNFQQHCLCGLLGKRTLNKILNHSDRVTH